jgi:hypothetical protein
MWRIVCIVLFLTCSLLRAEVVAPSSAEDALRSARGDELNALLRTLAVPEEIADYYSAGEGIEGFRWFYLRDQTGRALNVLQLPCSSIFGAPIFLLEDVKDRWKLRDREGMDCHYDDSASSQLVALTSNSQLDLLLHHSCDSHGSGYVEQHTRVLRVVSMKFVTVLDEPDVIHDFPLNGPGSFQESTFIPTAPSTLEETRTTATFDENEQPKLQSAHTSRRYFRWNGQRFIKSGWKRLR